MAGFWTTLCCFQIFTGYVLGVYLPARELEVTVTQSRVRPGEEVTRVGALLYSGAAARGALYTVSSPHYHGINVTANGTLLWNRSRITPGLNMTLNVEASYKSEISRTLLKVHVVKDPEDPCKLSTMDRCFPVRGVYRVYEDTVRPVLLGRIGSEAIDPCTGRHPVYKYLAGDGGRLVGTELWFSAEGVVSRVANVSFECRLSNLTDPIVTNRSVELVPRRVKLPDPMAQARNVSLKSAAYRKGESVIVGWVTVAKGSKYSVDKVEGSSDANVTISGHDFHSDMVEATLLIVNVTWTRSGSLALPHDLKIIVSVITPQPVYIVNKVELSAKFKLPSGVDDVEYPAGPQEIGVNAGPFTRLAQSNIALNSSTAAYKRVRFRMALPEYLQSPFNVTPAGGILYLTEWGPQALATLTSTAGVLIEWYQSDGGLVEGVHWISVDVVPPRGGCPVQGPAQLRGWALCHERSRNTTCLNTCGLAVHPSRNGKCQWRKGSNMAGILTTNYSTCTSDVDHCPDGVCDPLEDINRHICPQDCTRTVIMGTSNPKTLRGIYSGVGVCTCDTVGKCHCGPPELPPPQRQRKTTSLPTTSPTNPTSLNNTRGPHVRAAGNERCDASCMVMLITSGVCITLLIAGSIFYFSSRSGWIKKKQTVIESSAYSTDALLPLPSTEVNQQQTEPQPVIEMDPKWEIPRSRIIIESCLGEGEFGKVLKASAKDLPSHPGISTVAVKTLKDNATTGELSDLLSEYQLLKEIAHPNVIRLLGACTTPGQPVYVIIEFCALGSLRNYLRKSRNVNPPDPGEPETEPRVDVTPKDILSFAWQICKGMSYLTEIKLVHRDLAARNILLAAGKMCKISDFGLTRDVYEDDTYLKKSRGRVPVKWMALESLSDQVYTSKSDVWSFGVVVWELVTLGSSPYPGVPAHSLFQLLRNGYRMQRPNNCSQHLYDLMKRCWAEEPSERPSFMELTDKFERMLEEGTDYLDCNVRMVANPSYFNQVVDTDNIDIRFDFEGTKDMKRYENENAVVLNTYDFPKSQPVPSIAVQGTAEECTQEETQVEDAIR